MSVPTPADRLRRRPRALPRTLGLALVIALALAANDPASPFGGAPQTPGAGKPPTTYQGTPKPAPPKQGTVIDPYDRRIPAQGDVYKEYNGIRRDPYARPQR